MGKRIGLTYNVKTDWVVSEGEPKDANAEFDKPETIENVVASLEAGGHTVERIGDARALLKKIGSLDVDIVFNLCEGRRGRNRESEVPLLLEMHDIPYVGADALTLGLTLDKVVAKKIFIAEAVPTPRFFVAERSDDLQSLNTIGYPLIVKTSWEGSSKGISNDSRVNDLEQLKERVCFINETYEQPALVEELIQGQECTVAVIGNEPPLVMPIVQTVIDGQSELGDKIYTNARIYSDAVQYVCPARFPEKLKKRIEEISLRVYKAVGCRDLGRIDFRIDENGNPYVLEINPLPSLDKEDVFHLFPGVIGSDFAQTLNKIIDFALARYGLLEYDISDNEKLVPSTNS